jgi:hypothetical protein
MLHAVRCCYAPACSGNLCSIRCQLISSHEPATHSWQLVQRRQGMPQLQPPTPARPALPPCSQDGDFSEEHFRNTVNAALANNVGNMLNRTLGLLRKNCAGVLPASAADLPEDNPLREAAARCGAGAWLRVCVFVYFCMPVCSCVCCCVPLRAVVCRCVQLCAVACRCVPLCAVVCRCVPLCAVACRCVPLRAVVCRCVPLRVH